MTFPILFLFYPHRNPTLSYTRQFQALCTFTIFILVTLSAAYPDGPTFIPAIGVSLLFGSITLLLSIASTKLSRMIEDQFEMSINARLRYIVPYHDRLVGNNLEPASEPSTQEVLLYRTSPEAETQQLVSKVGPVDSISLPRIQSFELHDPTAVLKLELNNDNNMTHLENTDFDYLTHVPYEHLDQDLEGLANDIMADPPVLIDALLVLGKCWRYQPTGSRTEKRCRRCVCYIFHIMIYFSPMTWAFLGTSTELELWKRLVIILGYCVFITCLVWLAIWRDYGLCKKALKAGHVEGYLRRLHESHLRTIPMKRRQYNLSLYLMYLINVVAGHYKMSST